MLKVLLFSSLQKQCRLVDEGDAIQLAEAHQDSREQQPWGKFVHNFSMTSSKATLLSSY